MSIASLPLPRITFTCDEQQLAGVGFLIENVVEKWPVKEVVYRRLDAICPHDCVFAANTSAIPITRIASVTHLFYPCGLPFVELDDYP